MLPHGPVAARISRSPGQLGVVGCRFESYLGSQFDSNGTAGQAEMRRRSEHVPIVSPDFGEPGICGSHQMERVESAQITRWRDRKSTRLNSSHLGISYAV